MGELKNTLSKDRIKLQEKIPLSQPAKVCIDPADVCNFNCDFCGLHNNRNKAWRGSLMSVDIFDEVLKQLLEFDYPINQIHLYGLGEPLLNPNIVSFIKKIKEKKVSKEIVIVSNGSLLTHELSEKLIKAGLDEMRVSLNGLSDEDYQRITGTKVSFERIFEEISYYHQCRGKIHVKILGDYFDDSAKRRFVDLFRDHCNSFNITNTIRNLEDQQFSVSISGMNQHNLHFCNNEKEVCPQMFYELVIHPNGDVGPCSADYRYYVDSLGNIKNMTLKEIWNCERLKKMRVSSLKGERINYGNCDTCLFPKNGSSTNITPYREEILKKLNDV